MRHGVVERVLPVQRGGRVETEQLAGPGAADSGPSPTSRVTLTSPPDRPFAFSADLLSRPVTDFLAAFRNAQREVDGAAEVERERGHAWARGYEGARARGKGDEGLSPTRARIGTRPRASSSVSHLSASSSLLGPPSPLPRTSADPFSLSDGRPFDPTDASEDYTAEERAATARWVAERLEEREDEFLDKDEVRVWCGTFNVNDRQPKGGAQDVQPWVDSCDGAELLVFAFQELDLSTEAMLRYTPYREDVWRRALEEALAKRFPDISYSKLHSRQLVGALMIVYVRDDVRRHVSDVSSASLATGLMGMLANKGAVAIRLRYRDAPLTFVNSHLAAFVQNVAQRNAQFRDTAAQLVFPRGPGASPDPSQVWTPDLRPESVKAGGEGWSVWESEALIWLGDLNYRVDLPRADVDRMVRDKEYDLLLRFDQLRIQQEHELAFQGFREAPITFAPSFKFDNGTQNYDTSEKQRVPSWTDRVLYLGMRDESVRSVEQYQSHPEVTMSDHKPVSAMLHVSVYDVLQERRQEVQREIVAELDQYDSDELPDVKLSPGPSVDFDEIRYDEPVSRQIEVVNVGSAIAPWSFVVKPGTSTLTPPWLTISPTSGLVLPSGRQTITLTIRVTSATGSDALSFPVKTSAGEIADLLVLSVRGKDLFLSLAARSWRPTVFGARLPHLVRLPGPIRETSLEERVKIAQVVAADEAGEKREPEAGGEDPLPRSAVPLALHSLVGFLAEHALDVPGLFATPGDDELIQLARDCLDTGADFPSDRFLSSPAPLAAPDEPALEPHHPEVADAVAALDALEADIGAVSLSSPSLPSRPASPPLFPGNDEAEADHLGLHSLADCALVFLEALGEPVVCWSAYGRALECEDRDEAYRVVRELPEAHANTLLYILAFLRVLLNQTADPQERDARRDRLGAS
ncbi:Endonuclease/exonuclease/phosphatase [Rhodotorula diobovata]|uniref:Endonuclease/exonuclease/phosphatase n=1 Tax=Rhodotorula diobovata TaxID=5288 RepID=A0A5C5G1L0_9BASI|nr:Endonuclease/exonuclease/phosphatase [Rhodotorula diobovata]